MGLNFNPTNQLFGHETSVSYSGVRVISEQLGKSQGRKNGLVKKIQGKIRLMPCREIEACTIRCLNRIGGRYNGEGVILRKRPAKL